MILCDHHIEAAIRAGEIIVGPVPDPTQFDSSALNLRVGDDFQIWKKSLKAEATKHHIHLDRIDLSEIIDLTDPLLTNADGLIVIPPGELVLVRTLEHLELPLKAKLAARVEGRSKQARLGLTAHITAPTIHAGFRGRIVLEILNHGPFYLEVVPRQSMLCQLVFERVSGIPRRSGSKRFSEQATPLGTPRHRKRP